MCIFCKIISGEIPSCKVYEDEHVLAVLDISQLTYGHTLVIPKKHYESMFDVEEENLQRVMFVVNKLCKEYKLKGIDGVNVITNAGEVSGQEVLHLHFHILPRYRKDEFGFKTETNKFDLNEVLSKMKI